MTTKTESCSIPSSALVLGSTNSQYVSTTYAIHTAKFKFCIFCVAAAKSSAVIRHRIFGRTFSFSVEFGFTRKMTAATIKEIRNDGPADKVFVN